MTSRERLMAVLQHKIPDRVPVSTYDMTGWHFDPRDQSLDPASPEAITREIFFTYLTGWWNKEPSYGPLMSYLREHADCLYMTDVPMQNAYVARHTHIDQWKEGKSTFTRITLTTPKGDLSQLFRMDEGVYTAWELEHRIKDASDIDKYLSIPYEPIEPDVSHISKQDAYIGEHGILLVEDAAHAIGTRYKGKMIGSSGTSMFSFHPIKNITTGEGGMLVTDNIELGKRARSLKFHGLGVDAYDRMTHQRAPQAQVVEPGFKFNMPDMQAVLALGQLARIEEINAKRTALAMRYREKLAEIEEIRPLSDPDYEIKHAWHLFIVRVVSDRMDRDTFMAELKARNIGTGLHFRCTHLQKYYRDVMGCKPGSLPNTEWNSDRILSLPLFPSMTEGDQDDVINAIKEILAS